MVCYVYLRRCNMSQVFVQMYIYITETEYRIEYRHIDLFHTLVFLLDQLFPPTVMRVFSREPRTRSEAWLQNMEGQTSGSPLP